jgi:hypothetical protein
MIFSVVHIYKLRSSSLNHFVQSHTLHVFCFSLRSKYVFSLAILYQWNERLRIRLFFTLAQQPQWAKAVPLSRIHDHTDQTTWVYIPVSKLGMRPTYNKQTFEWLHMSNISGIYKNVIYCHGNTHYNTFEWFYLKKEGVCLRNAVHAADTTRVQPTVGPISSIDLNWLFMWVSSGTSSIVSVGM